MNDTQALWPSPPAPAEALKNNNSIEVLSSTVSPPAGPTAKHALPASVEEAVRWRACAAQCPMFPLNNGLDDMRCFLNAATQQVMVVPLGKRLSSTALKHIPDDSTAAGAHPVGDGDEVPQSPAVATLSAADFTPQQTASLGLFASWARGDPSKGHSLSLDVLQEALLTSSVLEGTMTSLEPTPETPGARPLTAPPPLLRLPSPALPRRVPVGTSESCEPDRTGGAPHNQPGTSKLPGKTTEPDSSHGSSAANEASIGAGGEASSRGRSPAAGGNPAAPAADKPLLIEFPAEPATPGKGRSEVMPGEERRTRRRKRKVETVQRFENGTMQDTFEALDALLDMLCVVNSRMPWRGTPSSLGHEERRDCPDVETCLVHSDCGLRLRAVWKCGKCGSDTPAAGTPPLPCPVFHALGIGVFETLFILQENDEESDGEPAPRNVAADTPFGPATGVKPSVYDSACITCATCDAGTPLWYLPDRLPQHSFFLDLAWHVPRPTRVDTERFWRTVLQDEFDFRVLLPPPITASESDASTVPPVVACVRSITVFRRLHYACLCWWGAPEAAMRGWWLANDQCIRYIGRRWSDMVNYAVQERWVPKTLGLELVRGRAPRPEPRQVAPRPAAGTGVAKGVLLRSFAKAGRRKTTTPSPAVESFPPTPPTPPVSPSVESASLPPVRTNTLCVVGSSAALSSSSQSEVPRTEEEDPAVAPTPLAPPPSQVSQQVSQLADLAGISRFDAEAVWRSCGTDPSLQKALNWHFDGAGASHARPSNTADGALTRGFPASMAGAALTERVATHRTEAPHAVAGTYTSMPPPSLLGNTPVVRHTAPRASVTTKGWMYRGGRLGGQVFKLWSQSSALKKKWKTIIEDLGGSVQRPGSAQTAHGFFVVETSTLENILADGRQSVPKVYGDGEELFNNPRGIMRRLVAPEYLLDHEALVRGDVHTVPKLEEYLLINRSTIAAEYLDAANRRANATLSHGIRIGGQTP